MLRLWSTVTPLVIALAMTVVLFQATPAEARGGRIQLSITKASFVVGIGGGSGLLRYRGRSYPLSIGGVKFGLTIGVASADLRGRVYHMRRLRDIEGAYTVANGSAAFGIGAASVTLENSRGVQIVLHGDQVGFEAALALGGMTIRLD